MENITEIKSGFIDYLKDKYGDDASNKIDSYSPELSIFMYSTDFQHYLVDNGYADVSVFSQSISEIKDMLSSGQTDNIDNEGGESNNNGDNFIVTALTDVLSQDEDLSAALNTNNNNTLDIEEVTAFLDSVDAAMQAAPDSYETVFDGIAKGIQDIKGIDNSDISAEDVLESIYNSDAALEYLDLDGDGEISDFEKALFENYVQGDNEELSAEDLQTALQAMEDGTYKYDVQLPEEALDLRDILEQAAENNKTQDTASPVQSSGSSGSVGSAGGSYGTSGTSSASSGSSQSVPSNPDDMTLDQLYDEQSTRQANVDSAKQDVDDTIEAIGTKTDEYKEAKEAYGQALLNDKNISQDIKNQIADYNDKIEGTDANIRNLNTKIADTQIALGDANNKLDADNKTLAALESALASYPDESELSDEEKADVAAAKQEIQAQIDTLNNTTIPADEAEQKRLDELLNGGGEGEGLKEKLAREEENLEYYKGQMSLLENQIMGSENVSDETKNALEAYKKQEEELDKLRAELPEKQEALVKAQEELSEINELINTKEAEQTEADNSYCDFNFDFNETLTDSMKSQIEKIKDIFEANKDKYEAVEEATGIPAELICAIHYREGSCNFDTYLHNGQPLGQTTTLVPKGIYFDDWEEAAIDALTRERDLSQLEEGNLDSYLYYAECYNGTGYRDHNINSPYVWSGTDKYTCGMYVADGQFDPSYKDTRPGVAVIMKALYS